MARPRGGTICAGIHAVRGDAWRWPRGGWGGVIHSLLVVYSETERERGRDVKAVEQGDTVLYRMDQAGFLPCLSQREREREAESLGWNVEQRSRGIQKYHWFLIRPNTGGLGGNRGKAAMATTSMSGGAEKQREEGVDLCAEPEAFVTELHLPRTEGMDLCGGCGVRPPAGSGTSE